MKNKQFLEAWTWISHSWADKAFKGYILLHLQHFLNSSHTILLLFDLFLCLYLPLVFYIYLMHLMCQVFPLTLPKWILLWTCRFLYETKFKYFIFGSLKFKFKDCSWFLKCHELIKQVFCPHTLSPGGEGRCTYWFTVNVDIFIFFEEMAFFYK